MSDFQSVLERNREFADAVSGSSNTIEKSAVDALESFTRTYVREDAVHTKIVTPQQITDDDLDRQIYTAKPVKIFDKEPGLPAAVSVSLAGQPASVYLRTPRFAVTGSRVLSPMFTINVDELRTYTMDIRQVFNDNALKDILAHEDTAFFAGVNNAVGTTLNGNNALSGVPQYVGLSGGIDRANWVTATQQTMQKTPYRIHARTAVVNTVSLAEFYKWERNEMGGDYSQDVMLNGWTKENFLNQKLIATIKRDIVDDLYAYTFGDEQFFAKSVEFEKPTMFMEKRMFLLNYCLYRTLGMTISHSAAANRFNFN